jgi:hypothetical protein
MMRIAMTHRFVHFIPEVIEEGVVYISLEFATVTHKCCCGCGEEVVTPLSPTDWQVAFDGESISLFPSIGNWSFPCQSHYWIEKSRVRTAPKWAKRDIASGRAKDGQNKRRYYGRKNKDSGGMSDSQEKDKTT